MLSTAMNDTSLRITEIFHSIQGESTWAGLPCVFVRLTGCPLRCVWCDTAYAFSGGESLAIGEILDRVSVWGCRLVEVTGGEPLAQKGCGELLRRLADAGYQVLLETSGAFPLAEVDPRVTIIMDLKCPDSGEAHRNLPENLAALKPQDELKLVIASRADYEWARSRITELPGTRTVILSPAWGRVAPDELARWVLEDRLPVRVQVQLHKLLFGPETRGV